MEDFKSALGFEKLAYKIFNDKFGPQDPRTQDSGLWLSQITERAVLAAKNAAKGGSASDSKSLGNSFASKSEFADAASKQSSTDRALKSHNGIIDRSDIGSVRCF
jgi:protein TIF31